MENLEKPKLIEHTEQKAIEPKTAENLGSASQNLAEFEDQTVDQPVTEADHPVTEANLEQSSSIGFKTYVDQNGIVHFSNETRLEADQGIRQDVYGR